MVAVGLPLIATLLWVGLGALVSHLSYGPGGGRLPRLMWPAVGLAACVVLINSLTHLGITLPFNVGLIVLLALAGLWLERRALVPTPTQLGLLAITVGPVAIAWFGSLAISGPTIYGYLADTNTGAHTLGATFLIHHGSDFSTIPRDTTDGAMTARFFLDAAYPSGSHSLMGLLGAVTGMSLLWVNTPMMGICLVVSAMAAARAARGLDVPRVLAALTGLLVSCGALTFSFALTGQLKELVTLPVIIAMSAIALNAGLLPKGWRAGGVLALLCAALYAVIGVAAISWSGAFVVFVLVQLIRRDRAEGGARSVPVLAGTYLAAVVVLGIVFVAALIPDLAQQIANAKLLSQSNASLAADPGNLRGPIQKAQALGTWISSDHRGTPFKPAQNAGFIAISWLLVGFGAYALLRYRRMQAVWFAALIALWFLLTSRGTMWLDSKVVMLNGVTLMLMLVVGIALLGRWRPGHRGDVAITAILAVVVLAGVARSDLELLRGTTTASKARYDELTQIDKRFEGQGPALYTEFDEYAMYPMRHMHLVGDGFADAPGLTRSTADGKGTFGYGAAVDVDQIPAKEVASFPLVVTLKSPLRSSPGSGFTLAMTTAHYDVWKRDAAAQARVVEHVPVGETVASAAPTCSLVQRTVDEAARAGDQLIARRTPVPTVEVPFAEASKSPDWAASFPNGDGVFGDGRMQLAVPVAARAQARQLWIEGSVGRPLAVLDQNRKPLGRLERFAGGNGNVVGPVTIPAGTTSLFIESTKREIRPGDRAPTVLHRALFSAPEAPQNASLPATAATAKSLCGGAGVDWIDVVRP